MNASAGTPALRVLRLGLHLLVAALLLLVAGRALAGDDAHATAVVATTVAIGAVYAAGPVLARGRRSRSAQLVWLGLLCGVWLVLLALTPDGTWLAFPLFLVLLHLLPVRAAIAAVLATTIAAILAFAAHRDAFTAAAVIGPTLGAAVAIAAVLGYQALYRESEQRRRLIEQLDATRDVLAATERRAGVAAERERLAREIHDTLAQGLTSIQLLLRAAERALPGAPETAAGHVRLAREAAQENLAEARQFVRALPPPDLERGSLPVALERLCATTAERSSVAVELHLSGSPVAIATPYEATLLRIAQSALANCVQHAEAARATVTLSYMDDAVALDVVDDGVGFAPGGATPLDREAGFGLATMRDRVRALGGTLSVESAPGQGTAIAVLLPLVPGEPDPADGCDGDPPREQPDAHDPGPA